MLRLEVLVVHRATCFERPVDSDWLHERELLQQLTDAEAYCLLQAAALRCSSAFCVHRQVAWDAVTRPLSGLLVNSRPRVCSSLCNAPFVQSQTPFGVMCWRTGSE
jgi:hypothetical protein